jgi:hypothetical protein
MGNNLYSRKEFLNFFKANKNSKKENVISGAHPELSDEKKEFLENYTLWLKDFGNFVKARNTNTFDLEQNKKIMELASKIEKEKSTLEDYMQDPLFAEYFKVLTKDISSAI